jgi:hypothetical protein
LHWWPEHQPPQAPEPVVEFCLRRIGKTPSFISGNGNRMVSFLMRHAFWRKMAINLMGNTTRKMYGINN